jgi:hypothetical protein
MELNCYFLDEPLSRSEENAVSLALVEHGVIDSIEVCKLNQIRVPLVVPAPEKSGTLRDPVEKRIEIFQRNLRKAGIGSDVGRRVLWLIPKDEIFWGVISIESIFQETGFYPYVVRRRSRQGNELVRHEPWVIDGHGMMVDED